MSLSVGVGRGCLFVLFFGVFAPRALAAIAVCKPGWEWGYNSKNQSACEIAGALEAACQGTGSYELSPLGQGENYATPQVATEVRCDCNTVMFSLYMFCAACQDSSIDSWSYWSKLCTEVYVTEYPLVIPPDAPIPRWAFLDYTVKDAFDPVAAKSAGAQPERIALIPTTVPLSVSFVSPGPAGSSGPTISGPPSPIPTSPPSVLTGSSQRNDDVVKTPVPSSTSSPVDSARSDSPSPISTSVPTGDVQKNVNQTKKPPLYGCIIGGVIGGLAFLAVVAAGVWIFLRRHKPSGERIGWNPLIRSDDVATRQSGANPSLGRPYDPSDPSTFPSQSELETAEVCTTAAGKHRYTGAAEL